MRRLFAGDTEPISIAVRTSGFSVEAHPAVLARFEVRISDPVAFGERLSSAIGCDVTAHRFDCADHFVSQYLRDAALDFGTVSAPEVQIGAADICHTDSHEHVVRGDGWDWVFPEFHRGLRLCEDSDFSSFHSFRFPCGSVRYVWNLRGCSVDPLSTSFQATSCSRKFDVQLRRFVTNVVLEFTTVPLMMNFSFKN